MKKSIYAIAASIATLLSGCSLYTAPWDQAAYEKAPVVKEAQVYQQPVPSVNAVNVKKAPVLDSKTNVNNKVQTKQMKQASVVKEKVINVPTPKKNSVPKVTESIKIVEKPVEKSVMLIPIE